MKKAFTLVELIIVIGIILVLSAALLVGFGGATESARAAKCQSNMRSLAQACYNIAMADEYKRYPHAGSAEYVAVRQVNYKYQKYYGENKGWISWLSDSYYDGFPTSHRANQYAGCFADYEDIQYAYTNGALWRVIGASSSCYKCPTMVKKTRRNGREMAWSYAMNSAFRYDSSYGSEPTDSQISGKTMGSMARADRTLLFAELNLEDLGEGGGNGDRNGDCVLEYDDGHTDNKERIGFNHKSGKKTYAHVVFADCHTERLVLPEKGDLYELTKWLCKGYDIIYNAGEYKDLKESIDD